jgi:glycosyltransferase involved in cell wall biosynthesis|tara:strand:+ start:378 stop:1268 length:891 start_codon:yes stop_codon:yes gene_type:complete
MKFSIVIPTFNNLEYLKLCVSSIKKNSIFNHEIIVHNNGENEPINAFLEKNNILYTQTGQNIGITGGVNTGAQRASTDYIVYAHDDFYFLPGWDIAWKNEIENLKNNFFYLSGTMVQNGQVNYDCGDSIETFDEQKLLNGHHNINYYDFQGSTWAPHIIHKDLWKKVGGFSEEFFPGTGSDPDLNLKLWNLGVRIFKGIGNCKVYHFGSIVTRKKFKNDKSIITDSGRKGAKTFLKKWGFSIKFFTKHYLRGCRTTKFKKIICNKYDGPLLEPKKSFNYYLELLIDKIKLTMLKND